MKRMTVAAVQLENRLQGPRANAERMRRWIERAADAGADLVVFPEGCLTGYSIAHARDVAIDAGSPAIAQVEAYADDAGVAVGYGYVERSATAGVQAGPRHSGVEATARCENPNPNGGEAGGSAEELRPNGGDGHPEGLRSGGDGTAAKPYVTYAIASRGQRLVYRKTHLGASEAPAFAPGDEIRSGRICGVRMGVQLCWEAHLPQVTATLRAQGAELVVMPHASGVGGSARAADSGSGEGARRMHGASGSRRLELWDRYLPARAYDNGLFVLACNALMPAREEVVRSWIACGHDGPGAPGPDALGQGICSSGGPDARRSGLGAGSDDAARALRGGGLACYGPDGACIARSAEPCEAMLVARIGGALPREAEGGGMRSLSYFDRLRPELYL